MAALKGQQVASLATLVAIRDDPDAPAAARIAAARDILDRTMGKPAQRVEASPQWPVSSAPVAEVARLEAEVRHLLKDAPP